MGVFESVLLSLAAEGPLKLMINDFYFMLKDLSVLMVFKFLSRLFGHVGKQVDKKPRINFKIYDVTDWQINNYNTHIAQYLKK